MFKVPFRWALLSIFLSSCAAIAQVMTFPTSGDQFGHMASLDAIQTTQMDFNLFLIGSKNPHTTGLQNPSGSVSKLDLKAPPKARREYEHGYQLLLRKDLKGAVEHLAKAIAIYPQFVAAHNALGSAYLNLGKNDLAQGEFSQAVGLDDHLPSSYLNLGCADLALKDYPGAEEAFRKASAIAPLDIQLQLALAYGEFLNHDYAGVLATAAKVHEGKHEGAAVVHYFAAGAWEAQGKLPEAQHEMETLLLEEPNSAAAGQFRQILEEIKVERARPPRARAAQKMTVALRVPAAPTPEQAARHAQEVAQDRKEEAQIAEAEAAPDSTCLDCASAAALEPGGAPASGTGSADPDANLPAPTFRVTADEVTIFFAATDHGKSVTDLAASDVAIRDDSRPPGAILGFRNESQLPLRLGLIVDMSESVKGRFSFEQAAATKFLQEAVVDKNDLAFVVGVNNSVLLVQDFTADPALTSRGVNQLAPGGGTALWDAVAFASDKLAGRPEAGPVARMLVVISDGEDNSSGITLKQAIARAQRGEVAVYTVSTREGLKEGTGELIGDHALRALSELTGGTAFMPGSLRNLNGSLADLQQVIRGRYLVSYKPAAFQPDGRYRTIDIQAQKDGRKLKVFARKGYYASAPQAGQADH